MTEVKEREHTALKEALEFALRGEREMGKTLGHAVGRGKVYKLLLREWVALTIESPTLTSVLIEAKLKVLLARSRDALAGGNGGIDVDG